MSTVTLASDEYVVDWNYPLCHTIDMGCMLLVLFKASKYWGAKPAGDFKSIIFAIGGFLDLVLLTLITLSFVLNERASSPSINVIYRNVQTTAMALNFCSTFFCCFLTTFRSYIIVTEKYLKYGVLALNTTLTLAITIIFGFILQTHLNFNYYGLIRARAQRRDARQLLSALTMTEITLFCLTTVGNTVFVVVYIGRRLVQTEGYMGYFKKSMTAKIGLLLILQQLVQLIVTALIFNEVLTVTRSYIHSFQISYCLFTIFYYYSTAKDLSGAIEENNKARTTRLDPSALTGNMSKGAHHSHHIASTNGVAAAAKKDDHVVDVSRDKLANETPETAAINDSKEVKRVSFDKLTEQKAQ